MPGPSPFKACGNKGRAVILFWIATFLLVPFLVGGVVVGDEAFLLHQVYLFDQSGKSFGDFVRTPGMSYAFHHVLWFSILYASSHLLDLFTASRFLKEAAISTETIVASLMGIALCFTFLIRKMKLRIPQGLATVLVFFAGGFGLYTFCLGGAPECYMVLVISARLFFFESEITEQRGWKLALCDAVLCAFKIYSLILVVALMPLLWTRATSKGRTIYLFTLIALMALLVLVKLWLWNVPGTYSEMTTVSVEQVMSHLLQQLFSPWTGILFCLPALLVLVWHKAEDRRGLLFKIGALVCCAFFFSFFSFFDGDVPGGRYIFPYTLILLPEIATALSRLLIIWPRSIWLLPILILVFLPVALFGFPFYPNAAFPSLGRCTPVHPAIYSWRIVVANFARQDSIVICFRRQATELPVRDVSSPRVAPWRIAYLLSGGHTPQYIERAHSNDIQLRHDDWGKKLSDRLKEIGLGAIALWEFLGLLPGLVAIGVTISIANRIDRGRAVNPLT